MACANKSSSVGSAAEVELGERHLAAACAHPPGTMASRSATTIRGLVLLPGTVQSPVPGHSRETARPEGTSA